MSEYSKSAFKEMDTKTLTEMISVYRDNYTKDAIDEIVNELRKRREYSEEIIAKKIKNADEEDVKKQNKIAEQLKKPLTTDQKIHLCVIPAIIAVISAFSILRPYRFLAYFGYGILFFMWVKETRTQVKFFFMGALIFGVVHLALLLIFPDVTR